MALTANCPSVKRKEIPMIKRAMKKEEWVREAAIDGEYAHLDAPLGGA